MCVVVCCDVVVVVMLYVLFVLCTCFVSLVRIIEDDDWWAADICSDFIGPRVDSLLNSVFVYLGKLRRISRHINNYS